ncbi:MAG: hypothetical protein ACFCU8_12105, partial [Thermosynechococcaceae cyanobacterium]
SVIGVDELIAVPFIADLELDQPMFLANSVLWYRLVRNPGQDALAQLASEAMEEYRAGTTQALDPNTL